MTKRIYSSGFVECSICAEKPGSPTLCPSCCENRRLLDRVASTLSPEASKKCEVSVGVCQREQKYLYGIINDIRIVVKCGDVTRSLELPSEDTVSVLADSFEVFAVSLREL
ncbi:MAG: hypothetical protein GY941_20485 [Planctomycetes bacterium]|nr:hypothetical protein [Planctomycetota bacterium]